MGNTPAKMSTSEQRVSSEVLKQKTLQSAESFQFHPAFIEESNNGLYFNNVYLPEEVVGMILSYIDPKEILKVTLVCKKWCNLIKSESFWFSIYSRVYKKKPKKLPWYVYYCLFATEYFNTNLIKNGNGQKQFKYWTIVKNFGDGFVVEDPPAGADLLPLDIPEFNGKTSCFATSYGLCCKYQEISIENCPLLQLILNNYKPHIYVSEWVAGRFDCGCVYNLMCKLYANKLQLPSKVKSINNRHRGFRNPRRMVEYFDDVANTEDPQENLLHVLNAGLKVEQWEGKAWSKIEFLVEDYPTGVKSIVFQHQGSDTQFWKGHYGSKMAGGVLKILFDSIEPSA